MKITGNPIVLFFSYCWVLILVSIIRSQTLMPYDFGFVFIVIILQSFVFVSFSRGFFNQSYWVFSLLFFGMVPIIEIEFNVRSYVGMPALTDSDIMYAGIFIFGLNLLYAISYEVFKKRGHAKIIQEQVFEYKKNTEYKSNIFFIFSIIIGAICFIIVFEDMNNNLVSLFFRGGDFQDANEEWGPKKLIIQRFIRPMPMILFLSFVLLYGYKSKFKLLILFVVAVVIAFPTSLPRFVAASLYIPIIFVFVPWLKKGLSYFYFLILSLLFIFPLLNSFRRYSSDDGFILITAGDLKFFVEGHFDSFQTFAQVIAHEIITYGEQLVMVFLFWVPRSIWGQKPVSSGVEIGQRLGAYFTNMSANIYAEGWINFGFWGAVLFAILLGFISSKIDSYFYLLLKFNIHALKAKLKLQILAYFILSALFFITLRGDLVTGVSNTLGVIFAWSLVFLLSRLVDKKLFSS